ncbi:SidA/IucD/PvdA family monooxygenase [Kordia jejudonensis]|uniref:SidA/IucD/PvdA family monooxygenase n=1 Tax=Kordia jejudonensis TaxID=1348245 RepID=UPI00062961E4|nr:SidA/IucD/PvdA family monooxygenase [Kordia jejudonensis]
MKIYDAIGVGFGPANIAVACAMEEMEFSKNVLFLEARSASIWQEYMLFEDSDIQNHPLRDLVTPRNPRSKYSFTNFLFEHDRLFDHLNVGMYFPYRIEYTQYINWVASHFNHITQYDTKVTQISVVNYADEKIYNIEDESGKVYYAKRIIVAPGRTPNIPKEFKNLHTDRVVFLSSYLEKITKLSKAQTLKKVAVVGGSQSAIEIMLHLSANFPDTEVIGFHRAFGFKQKDVNPFTGEVYYPEFVDFFHKSNDEVKKRLLGDLYLTNYSASDLDVLETLYKKIYLQKIQNKQKIFIRRSSDIQSVEAHNAALKISYTQLEKENMQEENFDLVVLATGFKNTGIAENEEALHPLLQNVSSLIEVDTNNLIKVNYNYSLNLTGTQKNTFFLNGLCESSHGMGDAGSFSLLALRSQKIVESIKETVPFQINTKNISA